MTRRLFISSSANPRLKTLRRLARKGSDRVCLAEGGRAVAAAFAAGVRVHEVYAAPELLGPREWELLREADLRDVRVVEVEPGALASLDPRRRPDGVLATVDRPRASLADLPRCSLVVLAVGIERPGNLGTIARTACAAGADALVVVDACTDLYHPDVVRGSVGTVFQLPAATAETPEAVSWLSARGLRLLATSPDGDTPYWRAGFDEPLAVAFGSERHGLPEAWLRRADARLAIPMRGPADSLNVAVAAGVVLFEAARRRSEAQAGQAARLDT